MPSKPYSEHSEEWKQKHREASRRWRQKHPEKVREYRRKWNKEHPEKVKEYARKHHRKHKDIIREYKKRWWQKNRDKLKERRKEEFRRWWEENKERVRRDRKIQRIELIMKKGGKCELCGYNECFSALEFHHIQGNKEGKHFWEKKQFELDEVMLVCSYCHRAIHNKEADELSLELWKESQAGRKE